MTRIGKINEVIIVLCFRQSFPINIEKKETSLKPRSFITPHRRISFFKAKSSDLLSCFEKKLKNKAIIIFDDYDSVNFYGLVKVVNNFIRSQKVKRKYLIGRTLILELDNQT